MIGLAGIGHIPIRMYEPLQRYIIYCRYYTFRCEVPSNSTEEARMQLLVSWIIDHPNAVAEEEVICI